MGFRAPDGADAGGFAARTSCVLSFSITVPSFRSTAATSAFLAEVFAVSDRPAMSLVFLT
jgi:hypothetical protein